MRILKYQCDICQAIIEQNELCEIQLRSYKNGENLELCESCYNKIKKSIKQIKKDADDKLPF